MSEKQLVSHLYFGWVVFSEWCQCDSISASALRPYDPQCSSDFGNSLQPLQKRCKGRRAATSWSSWAESGHGLRGWGSIDRTVSCDTGWHSWLSRLRWHVADCINQVWVEWLTHCTKYTVIEGFSVNHGARVCDGMLISALIPFCANVWREVPEHSRDDIVKALNLKLPIFNTSTTASSEALWKFLIPSMHATRCLPTRFRLKFNNPSVASRSRVHTA